MIIEDLKAWINLVNGSFQPSKWYYYAWFYNILFFSTSWNYMRNRNSLETLSLLKDSLRRYV